MNHNMLYLDLMSLSENKESGFFRVDQAYDGRDYRIFLYRITNYSGWVSPGATFSRGTVYDITDIENPVLVSLCMEKFFNVGENPLAPTREDLTADKIEHVVVKSDGSLITAFRDVNGKTVLKSKGSFQSDQVVRAREVYYSDAFVDYRTKIESLLEYDCSINMEYVSPDNLIVVRYPKPDLHILSVVEHDTGQVHPIGLDYVLDNFDYDEVLKWNDREGVVIFTKGNQPGNGAQMVKLKSEWYLSLHRVRDEISNPVKVALAVLNGGIDDIRSAFPEFNDWVSMIEDVVVKNYNFYCDYMERMEVYLNELTKDLEGRERKKVIALQARESINKMLAEYDYSTPEWNRFYFGSIMGIINDKPIPDEKVFEFFSEQCKGMSMPIVERMKM